jgi:general L-amino acid transport system permease protein
MKTQDPFKSPAEMKYPLLFWLRKNLFSSAGNSFLTVIFLLIAFFVIRDGFIPLFSWDWTVITANLQLILVGGYPSSQLWRLWFCIGYIAVFAGLSFGISRGRPPSVMYFAALALIALACVRFKPVNRAGMAAAALLLPASFLGSRLISRRALIIAVCSGWILLLPLAFSLVRGFGGFMPVVKTGSWGGLLLSLLISLTCIASALPLGLFLALGRRSALPMVKSLCILFIEVIRGVPLVTILFVGYLIFPMALPHRLAPSVFVRALAGIVMFHSAYLAEAFRGGLQGISRTQYEAAASLNLSPSRAMVLVILPQVFKRMIPVLVNSFTSALKDTSLISIIGMLDMIGIGSSIVSNPRYIMGSPQILFFEGAIYFILCFSISKSSTVLEKKLGVTTGIIGDIK